jgi:hypothetical protein
VNLQSLNRQQGSGRRFWHSPLDSAKPPPKSFGTASGDIHDLQIQAKENTIRISGRKTMKYPDGSVHLSLNEKRAILASWASDACAIESAPALRNNPSGRVVVRRHHGCAAGARQAGRDCGGRWRSAASRSATQTILWRRYRSGRGRLATLLREGIYREAGVEPRRVAPMDQGEPHARSASSPLAGRAGWVGGVLYCAAIPLPVLFPQGGTAWHRL